MKRSSLLRPAGTWGQTDASADGRPHERYSLDKILGRGEASSPFSTTPRFSKCEACGRMAGSVELGRLIIPTIKVVKDGRGYRELPCYRLGRLMFRCEDCMVGCQPANNTHIPLMKSKRMTILERKTAKYRVGNRTEAVGKLKKWLE